MAPIFTPQTLARLRRHADRRRDRMQGVLAAMRTGATLHSSFGRQGPRWALSDGARVDETVARAVIGRLDVEPMDDALLPDHVPSQSYRHKYSGKNER